MSDKHLTELEWKRFAKGRGFKDGAFVKGLADLERAKMPDVQLSALDEIEKQSELLLKTYKGDKDLAAYLGEAAKAIDKQRKLSEFEVGRNAKEGEGDDGLAALGAKMLPLLRQVAKGAEGGALPVMVAVAGKEVAVLVARRTIGPAQKKLLDEALGHVGGIKYMGGECTWEANAHTFVLEAKVANLAKGIKAALQKQTDVRFKVRVRGSDPHDVDDDGDDGVGDDPHGESGQDEVPESPEKAQYLDHLRELAPRIDSALRAQTGDVGKLKAVFGFAQGKAKEGHYTAALQGLDAVAKLLDGAATIPPAPPLPPTTTVKPETDTSQPSDESRQFNERVNEMLPRIKEGLAAGMPGANGAKLKLSEAAAFARRHDWQAAHELLDEIDKELALDLKHMPRTLSPEDIELKAFSRKEELQERWLKTVPSSEKLDIMERGMVGRGLTPMAQLLQKKFDQLRKESQNQNYEAAMRNFASIQALTGSPEASRAEVRHRMIVESPSYEDRLKEHLGDQGPEYLDQLRREAADDGYGLTSDGMVRYALPVGREEWQRGALTPLGTVDGLLDKAASQARQGGRDPLAVLPLIEEIANEKYAITKLVERVRQYALDDSFTVRSHEEAALAIQLLNSEFWDALQPFQLMHFAGTDVDLLLRDIEELSLTLKDYATSEDGGGTTALEQLQQAIKDIKSNEFGAASALLKSLCLEIESSSPEGGPGENLNQQIASASDTRVRNRAVEKLYQASNELDILAVRKGLSFDGVLVAFQKLKKAANDFEKML